MAAQKNDRNLDHESKQSQELVCFSFSLWSPKAFNQVSWRFSQSFSKHIILCSIFGISPNIGNLIPENLSQNREKSAWYIFGTKTNPCCHGEAPTIPLPCAAVGGAGPMGLGGHGRPSFPFWGDNSLSQWPNFKLFGITYWVGKIKFKLFFSGSIGWVRQFGSTFQGWAGGLRFRRRVFCFFFPRKSWFSGKWHRKETKLNSFLTTHVFNLPGFWEERVHVVHVVQIGGCFCL